MPHPFLPLCLQDKALEHAASLFASVSITRSTDGRLSESQVHEVLRKVRGGWCPEWQGCKTVLPQACVHDLVVYPTSLGLSHAQSAKSGWTGQPDGSMGMPTCVLKAGTLSLGMIYQAGQAWHPCACMLALFQSVYSSS